MSTIYSPADVGIIQVDYPDNPLWQASMQETVPRLLSFFGSDNRATEFFWCTMYFTYIKKKKKERPCRQNGTSWLQPMRTSLQIRSSGIGFLSIHFVVERTQSANFLLNMERFYVIGKLGLPNYQFVETKSSLNMLVIV